MKKVFAALCALTLTAALAGCGGSAGNSGASTSAPETSAAPQTTASADSDLAYVQDKGVLVVGITDFEPMDYKDESGEWIGFDADMAKEFAKTLGVEVEFSEIDWDNKLTELNGKSVDCVWNGMTLTPDVTEAMSTSDPYCNNRQVVVVPADQAEQYQAAEDCMDLNFAVEAGSAGEEVAHENEFNTTAVKDQATALMEVAAGTCDAAIIDSLMAAAMVGEGTSYEDLTYTVGLSDEEYGVGFRKGSDLTQEFNQFLDEAKTSGLLEKTAEEYKIQAALIK